MAGSSKKSEGSGKLVLGVVAGVGLLATIAILRPNGNVILILLGAIILIVVLLLLYYLLLKWLGARKAAPFTQNVTQAAGSTPNAISAAASRAKLDDLRRNFETGVTKFNAAGKDLYQLPWYLLIGESGSGKTEAIRHSGIPFPPGLHDQLQGAGGTVNMNWWFTNEAVILDTAGRYLFDEVQPGASSEWTEFLKLLALNRPQCPINGLLLVIPANSLILDTADKIEAKAGKIAQQLDRIQRTLDLRFPVFVVVTKCDLINGFREFFDGLNDARQQHQILGWSNPAPLDEAFNPELVDEHLKTVHSRLMQRRLGLLLDPVARERDDARRIDEVDALYSLPDSFLRIGPRLRQYLEMVFVAGEWSPKPLFLRGIYFTSSMREGQALDAELAELLGVPVDSLSEGKMWDRDRAFFLRDLFLKKVFPEKGLVTRAVNAHKVERNRKMSLLAAGFAGTLALLGFTWTGARQLDNSVRRQADDWKAFENINFNILGPASAGANKSLAFHSRLDEKENLNGSPQTVGELHELLYKQQAQDVGVPLVLKPAAGIIDHSVHSADLNSNKHAVYRQIYATSVLEPLIQDTAQKLESERTDTWSASSTTALGELVRVRNAQSPDLNALFNYDVTDPAALAAYNKYSPTLRSGLALALPVDGKWPQPVHVDDKSLEAGIGQFIAYWDSQIAMLTRLYRDLGAGAGEPGALQTAHEKLAAVCLGFSRQPPKTLAEYQDAVKEWTEAWTKYDAAYRALSAKLDTLNGPGGTAGLVELYRSAHARATDQASAGYNELLAKFPAPPSTAEAIFSDTSATDELGRLRKRLQEARDHLGSTINSEVIAGLSKYDNSLLATTTATANAPAQRVFVAVHQMYQTTNAALLPAAGVVSTPFSETRGAVDAIAATLPEKSEQDKGAKATVVKDCDVLFDGLIVPKINYDRLLARLNENPKPLKEVVVARAEKLIDQPLTKSFSIPLTSVDAVTIPANLHPGAAALVLKEQRDLVKDIRDNADKSVAAKQGYSVPFTLDADALKARAQKRQAEVDAYVTDYVDFYEKLLDDGSKPSLPPSITWEMLLTKQLPGIKSRTVNDNLKDLGQSVATALQQISGTGTDAEKLREAIAAAALGAANATSAGDDYVKKMSRWRDLGSDSGDARNQLLKMAAREFSDSYLVSADEKKPSFVTLYWNRLTFSLLHVLATTPNQAAASALDKLRSVDYRKFPLSLKTAAYLEPAKIDLIRADVDRIIIPKTLTGGIDIKANSSIEIGGRINEGEDRDTINRDLDKLVGGGLLAKDWKTIQNLKTLLDAIPRAGIRYQCEVTVPPDQKAMLTAWSGGRGPAGPQFHRVQLEANAQAVGDVVDTTDPAGGALGSISYPLECPNGSIRFNFYLDQNTYLAHHIAGISIPSLPPGAKQPWPDNKDPWQCLRYISGHAIRSKDDPASWNVELIQIVRDQPYALWVRLKFEKPFPATEDWPQ